MSDDRLTDSEAKLAAGRIEKILRGQGWTDREIWQASMYLAASMTAQRPVLDEYAADLFRRYVRIEHGHASPADRLQ